MADKKPKIPPTVFRRAKLSYPYLNAPDTKFNAKGVYTVKAVYPIDDPTARAMVALIDKAHAVHEKSKEVAEYRRKLKKGKVAQANYPYEENHEEGTVTFNFKMNASYEKDGETKPLKPGLFDAKRKPLAAGVKIGGGTVANVSCQLFPYAAEVAGYGISLRLVAVQVLELVEFGGQSAASAGFEDEDGFEDDGSVADTADKADSDGGDDDGDDSGDDSDPDGGDGAASF